MDFYTLFGPPLLAIFTSDMTNLGDNLPSYVIADAKVAVNLTPLPGALPLFASGLGALGLLGWRRKRKAQATA